MTLGADYDRWHQQVFESAPEKRDDLTPWYQLVREFLPSVAGKSVLELACGRGGFSYALASLGARIVGADFSSSALSVSVQKRKSASGGRSFPWFVQADAHRLPFPDASFEIVVSCETIEHLVDPQAAVSEMARVCRPNGLLFVTTPNYFNLAGMYQLYISARGRTDHSSTGQPFDRRFLFPQVRRMFRNAGCRILRSDGTVHPLPCPGRNPLHLEFLESSRILRRLLSPFALHYFLLARRETPAA